MKASEQWMGQMRRKERHRHPSKPAAEVGPFTQLQSEWEGLATEKPNGAMGSRRSGALVLSYTEAAPPTHPRPPSPPSPHQGLTTHCSSWLGEKGLHGESPG